MNRQGTRARTTDTATETAAITNRPLSGRRTMQRWRYLGRNRRSRPRRRQVPVPRIAISCIWIVRRSREHARSRARRLGSCVRSLPPLPHDHGMDMRRVVLVGIDRRELDTQPVLELVEALSATEPLAVRRVLRDERQVVQDGIETCSGVPMSSRKRRVATARKPRTGLKLIWRRSSRASSDVATIGKPRTGLKGHGRRVLGPR